MQHAVFQPIFLQTLQAIGKCKRLQERLTVERRLFYLAEKTQPGGINSDVSFHTNSLRDHEL